MKRINKRGAGDGQFYGILFSLLLFATFTWLILTVAIDFGAEYGVSSEEIGEGKFDVAEYRTSLNTVEDSAETYRQRFEDGKVDDVDDASGLFSVITDMTNLITTPFTLLGKIAFGLGVPPLVISVALGLLVILIIFAGWRVLRAGA